MSKVMNIAKTRQYCMAQKYEAMHLQQNTEGVDRYNACQAVNAWDEILGQLHKHKKPNKKSIKKAVETAFFIINLMKESEYKQQQFNKIKSLNI